MSVGSCVDVNVAQSTALHSACHALSRNPGKVLSAGAAEKPQRKQSVGYKYQL